VFILLLRGRPVAPYGGILSALIREHPIWRMRPLSPRRRSSSG